MIKCTVNLVKYNLQHINMSNTRIISATCCLQTKKILIHFQPVKTGPRIFTQESLGFFMQVA